MPKILLIVGTHLRHLYFANKIKENFSCVDIVYQTREDIMPVEPEFNLAEDRINFRRHFEDRDIAEKKWFGEQQLGCGLFVTKEEVNSQKVIDYIQEKKTDIVITFGCTILKELLPELPKKTINVHQGLSPRYRGVATLFWPFYFYEPNHAGTTIHYIDMGIDSGDIIHQSVPVIEKGDGLHDVACKAVIKSTEDVIKLLGLSEWKSQRQKSKGKLFVNSDFRPEHLRHVYHDDIVHLYLSGQIKPPAPVLFKQF